MPLDKELDNALDTVNITYALRLCGSPGRHFEGGRVFTPATSPAFETCELTFFDPDNGLEVKSTAKGRKWSSKYAYLDEIADHYAAGRSLVLYQHFPRTSREIFIGAKASRLRFTLAGSTIWSFETPHVVFLLAAAPIMLAESRRPLATAL